MIKRWDQLKTHLLGHIYNSLQNNLDDLTTNYV